MTFKLDHVIIAVDDLDAAIADYRELGFNAFYGGEHAAGTTHNALICFKDGSYIELIALTGKAKREDIGATDFTSMVAGGQGLIGYALLSQDLEADVQAMRERGLEIGEAKPGSRKRADGVEIAWKSAFIEGSFRPFFIQDETPRNLRVLDDEQTVTHENGAMGIANLFIYTDDKPATLKRYGQMLGIQPDTTSPDDAFRLDGAALTVFQPATMDVQGEVVYRLVLHNDAGRDEFLPLEKTHQARIVLVPASS